MKTRTQDRRTRPRKGAAQEPVIFITKSQLAKAIGVEPSTLDDWIREGTVPPPHSRLGKKTTLWLRSHFDAFVRDRRWPREAFYGREDG